MDISNSPSQGASSRIAFRMALIGDPVALTAFEEELRAYAAEVLYYPASQTLPLQDYEELDNLLKHCIAGEIEWLLLPTPCAVDAIADRLAALKLDVHALARVKCASYGAMTQMKIAQRIPILRHGISPQVSHQQTVNAMNLKNRTSVALPLASHSRADWPRLVTESGAEPINAPAYRLALGSEGDDLPAALWGGSVDLLLFPTENSVRHFVVRLRSEGGTLDMLGDVLVATLDQQTAVAARQYELNTPIVPMSPAPREVAEALAGYFRSPSPRIS